MPPARARLGRHVYEGRRFEAFIPALNSLTSPCGVLFMVEMLCIANYCSISKGSDYYGEFRKLGAFADIGKAHLMKILLVEGMSLQIDFSNSVLNQGFFS